MTTNDLMLKIKDILEENGFEVTTHFSHQASATKEGKSWKEPVPGYDFTRLFGHTVDFTVVHRHNGTSENISVDISIYEWKDSRGKRLTKERINVNMSERQILNRVNKIIAQYNEI